MGTLPTIQVANLGMADSLILMVMALVVFGPRRLPQIGRQIGKLMYEFRKASNDFKFQMEEELRNSEEADRQKKEEARLATMTLEAPALTAETAPEPVTQVLESEIEHPGVYVPATAESPYPYEATYPALTETETQPETAAETQPEETYPRIQPPATGEPVPYSPAAEAATANEPVPAVAPVPVASEAPAPEEAVADPSAPVTEQAAHHG
jgi:sec-independent protein translocase protein TatB